MAEAGFWPVTSLSETITFGGVTREGATLVVEMNDGYALGCYGLAAVPYAQLLEARWQEMVS